MKIYVNDGIEFGNFFYKKVNEKIEVLDKFCLDSWLVIIFNFV